MTQLSILTYSTVQRLYVFYLVNPPSGTYNIAATCSSTGHLVNISAIEFDGVHQTTPLGTPATANQTNVTALFVNVSASVNDLVFDAVGGNDNDDYVPGAYQAELYDFGQGANSLNTANSIQAAVAGGTTNMSWSWATSAFRMMIGVAIKPV